MRKRKELHGLAVMDVDGGRKLGSIDDLIVAPDTGRILGFTLTGGLLSGSRSFVRMEDVTAIGSDAVTVGGESAARAESEMGDELRVARDASKALVGKNVVTKSGTLVGTVSDYFVDEGAARITGLEIAGGLLSSHDAVAADRVLTVGPDAVIVTDEPQQSPEQDASPWTGD